MSDSILVLPRPGHLDQASPSSAVEAPTEAAFVTVFGRLLPAASYVNTAHGRVAYYETGPSTARSADPDHATSTVSRILCLHGIQTPALGLQPLASAIASRFPTAQLVLIDLWGHGLTETPMTAHKPSLFIELIEAVLSELRWQKAHVIGYSFGGSTVVSYAAVRPDRIESMVLIAPAGLYRMESLNETEMSYMRGGDGLEEKARSFVIKCLEGGSLIVPADWRERVSRGEVVAEAIRDWEAQEHRGHLASVVSMFRDGGVFDRHATFAEASQKGIRTLCILGERDDVCTRDDLLGLGFDTVQVVTQAGHGLVRQNVKEVSERIECFWETLK